MRLEEVRRIARSRGIKPNHLSKPELIRAIQTEEGNFDCFASPYSGECDQRECLWREDCLKAVHRH